MEVNKLANNDEKYLDGDGLSDVLEKHKNVVEIPVNKRIRCLENQVIDDKYTIPISEIKDMLDSPYRMDFFKNGDVIDVDNGYAVLIDKHPKDDVEGQSTYTYVNSNTNDINNMVNNGVEYDFAFILIPKTPVVISLASTKPDIREEDMTELNALYNGMNIKEYVKQTCMYSIAVDRPSTNLTYTAYKNKSYLHLFRSTYQYQENGGTGGYHYAYTNKWLATANVNGNSSTYVKKLIGNVGDKIITTIDTNLLSNIYKNNRYLVAAKEYMYGKTPSTGIITMYGLAYGFKDGVSLDASALGPRHTFNNMTADQRDPVLTPIFFI